jgi:hypothetical protein
MNETALKDAEIPPQGEVKAPFFLIGNEVFDVFLPIMGADCFTLYAHFERSVYRDPKLKHSIRDLAEVTGLGATTILRSLEILEHLRLVKLTRFGGSRDSECQLLNSWFVAERLGAKYDCRTLSYSLPSEVAQSLNAEVEALREKQQGKPLQRLVGSAHPECGNPPLRVSQRNASDSPAIRQRRTRETQTGSHLIRKEERNKEVPTPTPSHRCEAEKSKDSPDEDGPDPLLKWAQIKFTGVMKDMGNHLLDTSKNPAPHLANGFADWQDFGLDSLAVEAATWRGEVLVLTLSASDVAAARRGLEKYLRTWNASLRKWYKCQVHVELQQSQRKC